MKPLSEDVKDLGRKARERLVQERRKRPEIMRLTTAPLPDTKSDAVVVPEKPTTITIMIPTREAAIKPRPKRKRRSSCNPTSKTRNGDIQRDTSDPDRPPPSVMDRWMPSVAHIQVPTAKKDRSTVVLLHGVPVGTTPRRIQTFFSGLDPRRIAFIVPMRKEEYSLPNAKSTCGASNTTQNRMTILEIDAVYFSDTKHPKIERYLPHQLRIMVQFRSAPTALLALQRSGEILTLPSDHPSPDNLSHDDDDDPDNEQYKRGAAIAVTLLRKPWSSFLGQHLTIDFTKNANWDEPLHETQMRIIQQVDSNVLQILWNGAIQTLHLTIPVNKTSMSPSSSPYFEGKEEDASTFTISIISYAKSMLLLDADDGEEASTAASAATRSKLEQRREFLTREILRLRNHPPFPFAEAPDPALLHRDPILKLTGSAMQILVDERNRIQHVLQAHSRWKWLRITNTIAKMQTTTTTTTNETSTS
jgi:hypothetical protein